MYLDTTKQEGRRKALVPVSILTVAIVLTIIWDIALVYGLYRLVVWMAG